MKKKINVKKNILGKCRNGCGKEGVKFYGNGMWVCSDCYNEWTNKFKETIESLKGDKTLF